MWHYQINHQQVGPVPWQQLQQLAKQGVVKPETPVRNLPNGQWVTASQLPNLILEKPVAKAVAPPVKRPAPSRVPTAVPLPAAPIPKPVGIAAPVAAPAPVFSPTPVAAEGGFAVSPTPLVSSRPALKTGTRGETGEEGEKSKLPLVIGVAVGGGIVACLLVVMLFVFNSSPPEKPVAKTGNEPTAPVDPDNEGGTIKPEPAAMPEPEAPVVEPPSESQKPPNEEVVAIQELLQKVPKFRDITRFLAGGKKPARIAVADLWFSADGQKERPAPSEEASPAGDDVLNLKALGVDPNRPPPGTIIPVPAEETGEPTFAPKYLHIAISVQNVGEEGELNYHTWNNLDVGFSERAILIDEEQRSYPLISAKLAPRTVTPLQTLSPGTETTDILVFAAPPANVSKLRLILPYQNVGHSDYLGFEIPASRLPYPQAATPATEPLTEPEPAPENELPPGIAPEEAGEGSLPTESEPAPEKPEEEKEQTIEDLRRSIEEGG